jgi:hypothetical protein
MTVAHSFKVLNDISNVLTSDMLPVITAELDELGHGSTEVSELALLHPDKVSALYGLAVLVELSNSHIVPTAGEYKSFGWVVHIVRVPRFYIRSRARIPSSSTFGLFSSFLTNECLGCGGTITGFNLRPKIGIKGMTR